MKHIKNLIWVAAIAAAIGMRGSATASRSEQLTMLVVPARYSVLQVMFDVLRRQPAVLISYQGDATSPTPLLHAWNGSEWVYVSLEDYETAHFALNTPNQAVLIGDEHTLPAVLVEKTSWCPLVMSVPAVDTATLVNSLGRVFNFRRSDWKYFSSRYNLELQDLNADRRQTSWYDQPFVDPGKEFPLFKRQAAPADESAPVQADQDQLTEYPESTEAIEPETAPTDTSPAESDLPPATVVIPAGEESGSAPAGDTPVTEYDSSIK